MTEDQPNNPIQNDRGVSFGGDVFCENTPEHETGYDVVMSELSDGEFKCPHCGRRARVTVDQYQQGEPLQ